jgi:peptidoglycan/xylan/chitin deacetylase (PgdA/CDA1 family)
MAALKSLAKTLLHSGGVVHGFRFLNRKATRILMYHRFPADTTGLREQCDHIRTHYQPITLSSLAESLIEKKSLLHNALTITVDDGYRDFFTNAFPVFHEYGIPATVFLVSDFLDQNLWLWWNQIEYAFRQTSKNTLDLDLAEHGLHHFSFNTPEEKNRIWYEVAELLTTVDNSTREEALEQIFRSLSVDIPSSPPAEWSALSWEEVNQMARNGVEFGAHTRTHPILSRIDNQTIVRAEVEGSKFRIEKRLGIPIKHFCYPNGGRADFTDETVDIVKKCGFQTAVTTERGMITNDSDPFLLRRIGVEPYGDTPYFRELLAGIRTR